MTRVVLFLNHACNLRCTYCYNGEKFQRRMPVDVMQRGLDLVIHPDAAGGGCVQVSFFGGEPLLDLDLVDHAMAYAADRAARCGVNLAFHLVTNATLLTDAVADRLLARQVLVAMSVDGCAEAHDATRCYAGGRSSYAEVTHNVRALLQRLPPEGARVFSVIDPANVTWMGASLDALLELGAAHLSMGINYTGAWDDAARARFQVALGELGARYVAAHRRGARFSLDLLDVKIATWLKDGYTNSDRCDFGCEEITVSPRGRLYPCERLVGMDDCDDVVIGDVWHGVDPARRAALLRRKNATPSDCEQCALRPRCMHWCGCVNHAMTGSVGGVSGMLCWFEQRIMEEADRCAATLYRERNPVFMDRFYPRGRLHVL